MGSASEGGNATSSCVPGANESRAYRAKGCVKCKTAPPAQCAGGAVRDASAALLGRSSRTHKLPARNEAESVGKEEDRRAIHEFQHMANSLGVKSRRENDRSARLLTARRLLNRPPMFFHSWASVGRVALASGILFVLVVLM